MKTDENDGTVHPYVLPNYERAVIPDDKLRKYVLDPEHVSKTQGGSSGKDKAVVFESALGFNLSNWEILKQRIIDGLPYCEAMLGEEDEHGTRYKVVLPILGVNNRVANVLTAWVIKPNTNYPSFTTARVEKK